MSALAFTFTPQAGHRFLPDSIQHTEITIYQRRKPWIAGIERQGFELSIGKCGIDSITQNHLC
jgi:hypothetical protein